MKSASEEYSVAAAIRAVNHDGCHIVRVAVDDYFTRARNLINDSSMTT